MVAAYDVSLAGVPEALLLLPAVATLAPVAWVLGAVLHVPVLDAAFLDSLDRIRASLRCLYPALDWAGEVRAAAVVDRRDSRRATADGLLFSGGVDSLASFLRHRERRPLLISVRGADIGLGRPREWHRVVAAHRAFAHARTAEVTFVASNFRTFFNHQKLCTRYLPALQNWYSAVQQGLGLAGLCAPLSFVRGLGRLLIAASHTPETSRPWGSHPALEGALRWAATEVVHDGYELVRHQKLGIIADHVRAEDPRLELRVCWGRATNCSRCAKCSLTMIGLALHGLDPNRHGFRLDPSGLERIRRGIEQGRLCASEHQLWLWGQIRRQAPVPPPIPLEGLDEFLAWLREVPLAECRTRHRRHPRTLVKRYLETRPEPLGRWIRKALGHPFP
jgi:hypothetical protein